MPDRDFHSGVIMDDVQAFKLKHSKTYKTYIYENDNQNSGMGN